VITKLAATLEFGMWLLVPLSGLGGEQMEHDISRLAERIDSIEQSASAFGELKGTLLEIARRPGWTSVAEFELVEANLESIQQQIDTAAQHYKQLIDAAGKVGEA
jgi:hypothetical protein